MAILPSGLWDCCTSGAHGKTQRRFQPCKKKKTHHKPKGAVVRLSFSHAEPIWNPCISYYSKTFSKSQHIALFFGWMLKIFWLLQYGQGRRPCEREKPSAVSQWTRIDKNEGKITSSAGGCLLCARAIVANFHRLRYTDSEKFL